MEVFGFLHDPVILVFVDAQETANANKMTASRQNKSLFIFTGLDSHIDHRHSHLDIKKIIPAQKGSILLTPKQRLIDNCILFWSYQNNIFNTY